MASFAVRTFLLVPQDQASAREPAGETSFLAHVTLIVIHTGRDYSGGDLRKKLLGVRQSEVRAV